jgi:Virulence factor
MAKYQVLYWKDIPAQVKVFDEGNRPLSRALSDRFQIEIDRIAMEEGLIGTDEYLNQWRWSAKQERPGTVEEVADALVRELEQSATFGEGGGAWE